MGRRDLVDSRLLLLTLREGEMPTALEERFLAAMRESYRMVQARGPRSPEKTKVLHGWVQEELRRELGDAYALTGQSPVSASEASVEGMYYGKNVDVLVSRDGQELGVVSVKFVITNYWQNSVNYFEQQVGETANLRRRNIVYGNLFCVTDPIPYLKRSGEVARLERLRDHDIQRYAKLRADHEHIHAPQEMAIGVVSLDVDGKRIAGLADPRTFDVSDGSRRALANELSIGHFFTNISRRIELRHRSP